MRHFKHIQESKGTKPIGDLFSKYKKILKAPQGIVVDTTIEVISDLIGIEIPKERISYKVQSKTLSLSVSGPLKSEILLHKDDILVHIQGRLGTQNAPHQIL